MNKGGSVLESTPIYYTYPTKANTLEISPNIGPGPTLNIIRPKGLLLIDISKIQKVKICI